MTNTYLYGTAEDIPQIPTDIINVRIKLLNKHLTTLLNEHYTVRDTVRINKVLNAIKFWSTINDKDK